MTSFQIFKVYTVILQVEAAKFSISIPIFHQYIKHHHISLNLWLSFLLFCMHACSVAQSCPTLCDLMDCSLQASSVHVTFQVRILEWVAIPFYRGTSWLRDRTCIFCGSCTGADYLPLSHQGCPLLFRIPLKTDSFSGLSVNHTREISVDSKIRRGSQGLYLFLSVRKGQEQQLFLLLQHASNHWILRTFTQVTDPWIFVDGIGFPPLACGCLSKVSKGVATSC